jgi:hypothetical protein
VICTKGTIAKDIAATNKEQGRQKISGKERNSTARKTTLKEKVDDQIYGNQAGFG